MKILSTFRHYASVLGTRQAVGLQIARGLGLEGIQLRVEGIRTPLMCRPSGTDRISLSQVLIQRDSDIRLDEPPKLIIDGGANVGYASVLFANLYPSATILAVEPNTDNLRMARINCAPYEQIKIIEGGIWKTDAALIIENPDADSDAFRVIEAPRGTAGAIDGYTIDGLRKAAGFSTIDLLKLDIEGAEEVIFSEGPHDWLDHVKALVIETHGEGAHRAVEKAFEKRRVRRGRTGEKLWYVHERGPLS